MTETPSLLDIFKQLGAADPERWADSEESEGVPQVARYQFLRQAWRQVVAMGDTSWIEGDYIVISGQTDLQLFKDRELT